MQNFRCYFALNAFFAKGVNIICGANAEGKTSIIEAISYLSLCKSFKGTKDNDVLKSGENYFFINAKVNNNEDKSNIIISYSENVKKIKKDNLIYQKNSDYIGYLTTITFEPADIDIVKGGPIVRRRLLNTNICQIDREYLQALSKCTKYLKLRNDYLKQTSVDEIYLSLIDEHFVNEAQILIKKRKEFTEKLSLITSEISLKMTEGKEKVTLKYLPNVETNNIKEKLQENRKYDLLTKTTNCGPQRDDVEILINGKKSSLFASQGQAKTAVISIKIALSQYFDELGKEQVILLDDVFSELDDSRQEQLLKLLNLNKQIFITTTNVDNIKEDIKKDSKIIRISKGGIV